MGQSQIKGGGARKKSTLYITTWFRTYLQLEELLELVLLS